MGAQLVLARGCSCPAEWGARASGKCRPLAATPTPLCLQEEIYSSSYAAAAYLASINFNKTVGKGAQGGPPQGLGFSG